MKRHREKKALRLDGGDRRSTTSQTNSCLMLSCRSAKKAAALQAAIASLAKSRGMQPGFVSEKSSRKKPQSNKVGVAEVTVLTVAGSSPFCAHKKAFAPSPSTPTQGPSKQQCDFAKAPASHSPSKPGGQSLGATGSVDTVAASTTACRRKCRQCPESIRR